MALEPGTSVGPYRILAPLGSGGMGEVYRAHDPRLGREVAIKVLPPSLCGDPERLRRFEREARAVGALSHPNVLAVHDVGTAAGTPYVVSELLQGRTLAAVIGGRPLPLRKCLDYAVQMAHGLAAAHAKGIVHRDLKPENVFVTGDGRVKILDFGLAKLSRGAAVVEVAEDSTLSAPRTQPGSILGTAGYMAPEQVGGEPADARSDIFSFGAVLFEMLFGRRAFKGETTADTLLAIVKADPLEEQGRPRTVPPGVERIVRHCLEKGPEERFQSARDLAFALEALSAAEPGPPATPESPPAGGGLTPGAVFADRYRMGGLLGRGGMGEVHRADDLKLGQPVALKLLPFGLDADPVRRERFLAEVRLARQIAHPNVCRVYDAGESGGQHFLSMEYVDGEDLASLLKRIGRLPADKALDVARQLTAGLAAAHQRGVLHRDLKPSNVMLDGLGRVRIMDFGLAAAADAALPEGDTSGTPAYMAPEQLAGRAASIRSDVYALGLVLYEIYTGRRAFSAASLEELRARKEQAPAVAPSELVPDIDPAVERVIMRAIDRDPRARPASVAQLAAALPGGTLLQAVLEAGDTPSPDLVAASGPTEGLEPARAWALLALVVAGGVAAAFLGNEALPWRGAALEVSPDTLASGARDTIARLGYTERPADQASGFETDLEYLRHLRTRVRSRSQWSRAEPAFFHFWHRRSPRPLESWRFTFSYGNLSRVTPADPPLDLAGMTLVRLEPSGRLAQLVVVPPPRSDAGPAPPPDWPALLSVAGYDAEDWTPTVPAWTPPVYADARAAWQARDRPGPPARLEAAALRGKPVYFEAVYPWTRTTPATSGVFTPGERAALALVFLVLAALGLGAAVFARRNVRAGRGDRRGAFRISAFVFTTMFVAWFFGESHVATLWEVALVMMALSWAAFAAAVCWLAYLAVEPFVRRRWPDVLVSWTRLLSGEVRDTLVGREVLIGCAAGPLLAALGFTFLLVPEWLGLAPDIVPADIIGVAHGLQTVVPLLVWRLAQSVMVGLAALFLLLLLRLLLGSERRALAAGALLYGLPGIFASEHGWISFLTWAAGAAPLLLLLLRVGLLAAVVTFYTAGLFVMFPLTADLQAWYAGAGVTALLVLALLALFGFVTSLGGRPALGTASGRE